MIDLREQIALLGRFRFEDVPAESFDRWLEAEHSNFPSWLPWTLSLLTFVWMAVALLGRIQHRDWDHLLPVIGALIAAQGAICLWLYDRVRVELEAAQSLIGQTSILREGLRTLRQTSFLAPALCVLQSQVRGEDNALQRLEFYLKVVEHRTKEWIYPMSLLIGGGTHIAFALERWKQHFDVPMRQWLAAWAEFEGLLALATYAAEHDENVYPQIMDDTAEAQFEAEGMTHPLLALGNAVPNDVVLGGSVKFLLISGSNMAGKSTLLRAVGANVVLGLAGAPVAARTLKMSALRIGASLSIQDSLADGKSKFLAEVERLGEILTLAGEARGQTLFLMDEIFSGTNSLDRRIAAEAVLRGLLASESVGALSTHDLALAELAEISELPGRNVHMASPDEANPLAFDYLLKPGINQTTNGLAIVRLLGLTHG
ncbi:MAG: hypothetical protein HIU91_05665 [Acidobacteria bacterium]|nr:hypothetical protein [Acidobacteriota bacterium]